MSAPTLTNLNELIAPVVGRYTPLFLDRAEGVYVWDAEGRRYLDFTSCIAVTNTGHCHPTVVNAIQTQAARAIHAQQNIYMHQPVLDASRALVDVLPERLNRVFWTNSGAEAVEGAIKLAKRVTGRPALVAFSGAFHGRTHAATTLTASQSKYRQHYEPLLPSVYHARYPYYFRSPVGTSPGEADDFYISDLDHLFSTLVMPDDVAAIVVEPIAGEGGYLVPSKRWIQHLRHICDEFGIFLVADEIQTGVGRTGKMWAFEHFDIEPDIVTVAKGLGSGMPVSAVVSTREIMDQWPAGTHGTTYGGNPVATAATAATLQVIRDESLVENAERMGRILQHGLRELQSQYPLIGDVRGMGLMIAAEFVRPDGAINPEAVDRVIQRCLEAGIVLISCGGAGQAVRIIPPLTVSEQQIGTFLEVFQTAVAAESAES